MLLIRLAKSKAAVRGGTGVLAALPLLAFVALALVALGYVAYALWPRWPEPPVAADAPPLPIVVGGVSFNVPPQAMRVAVQRRAGVQERIDLVYAWPALVPPAPDAKPPANPEIRDRVFLTIAAAGATLPPIERLKTVYPSYAVDEASPAPEGLAVFAFLDGSPYQGEDLVFDPEAPEKFLARCSRTVNPLAPGTCLYERRVGGAEITARFPRDWLQDWSTVEAGLDRLIGRLQASAAGS
jgi:hypothetical protein